jgi:hypothetical protein
MTRGLPWTVEEEVQLRKHIEANKSVDAIASILGRSVPAILVKCGRLGLVPSGHATTANLPLPAELPSVEETLKKLAGALEAASEPGLTKVEVQRLQVIATLSRAYQEILANYLNYREIEAKLNDMETKYAALLESKNTAPQPAPAQMATTPAE